jgi:hypothetical protein
MGNWDNDYPKKENKRSHTSRLTTGRLNQSGRKSENSKLGSDPEERTSC